MIDGVIDGYDGLSQAVSLSIYRLLRHAGEGAVNVLFFPERAPHPHRALQGGVVQPFLCSEPGF
jgi:hypothetical protein